MIRSREANLLRGYNITAIDNVNLDAIGIELGSTARVATVKNIGFVKSSHIGSEEIFPGLETSGNFDGLFAPGNMLALP
jgi:hypothetical protein